MPKILVAGITEKHVSAIPDVLRMAGYDVLESADSKTAFQFVLEEAPALIVAKSNLPQLDGLGFLHIIRKHPQFALTPLIFLVETEGWDEVRRMMTAGADDFLFSTWFEIVRDRCPRDHCTSHQQ